MKNAFDTSGPSVFSNDPHFNGANTRRARTMRELKDSGKNAWGDGNMGPMSKRSVNPLAPRHFHVYSKA